MIYVKGVRYVSEHAHGREANEADEKLWNYQS